MFNRERLDFLLNQPMSRRDFLRNLGLMALSIIGLHAALTVLSAQTQHNGPQLQPASQQPHGFGGGKYGV